MELDGEYSLPSSSGNSGGATPLSHSSAPSCLPLDRSVKMKGLPFKASPDDIMRFFQGYVLRADNIFLKRHPDGRPNGEVNLGFVHSRGAVTYP